MKRSETRILTTHVGSLPRPERLLTLMRAKESGAAFDEAAYQAAVRDAVGEIVGKQVELGIDIIDDGEESKVGFVAYLNERLAGFEKGDRLPGAKSWQGTRDSEAFPEFYDRPGGGTFAVRMVCRGPVSYKGHRQLRSDIDNLKAALKGAAPAETFMPAATPASVEGWQRNEYYKTEEDYLFAIADALREEYKAIIDAGFLLQVDDPWLVMHYMLHPELSVAECRKWAGLRIAALNHALRGIPEEKIRHHTCYGINMGPRTGDMAMKDIIDIVLTIRAGAYSFEAANPRHEHEWRLWQDVGLPAGKAIIPGVISHTTVLVEHPELVAERIIRFAEAVGRENVIAGADCGFASHPSADPEIHPTIVWAKLAALTEGARIASERLWR